MNKKVGIINASLDFGAGTRGTCFAPRHLLFSGLAERLTEAGHDVSTFKCTVASHDDNNVGAVKKAKYLEPIVKTCENLATIADSVYTSNAFPLVIGGDHSIMMGSFAGVAEATKRRGETLGVLYVDAHADFNTTDTTLTGNIHGQCLSACCGIGIKELTDLYSKGRKLDPANICIVGARALDPEEKRLLREAGARVYTAVDIERQGIATVMTEALEFLQSKVDKIHLSFDIDVVDPIYAPGTGILIPGGLTYREAITIAEMLSECPAICSADIVELNPIKDLDSRTTQLCLDFIAHLMGESYF